MRQTELLAAVLAAAALSPSCRQQPAPQPPASAPTRPEVTDNEPKALSRLVELEAEGRRAIAAQEHGRLLKAAEALAQLRFASPQNVSRRDELAAEFGRQARAIRDALHRFLFAELKAMPATERKALLDRADAGDAGVVERAAGALAGREFAAGRRYLRAVPGLRAGTVEAATGLPVRYAGRSKLAWKGRFDETFNARMRELARAGAAAK